MDFLLNSHKKTSFVETVSDHDLKCWIFFLFPFFLLQYQQAVVGLKNTIFFFVAFHLSRVVLTFKQNKAFGRIIIISSYPSEELSNLPTLLDHIFLRSTLKGNFPFILWALIIDRYDLFILA